MALEPKIPKKSSLIKTCPRCGRPLLIDDFTKTRSIFYQDGTLPICNYCINDWLKTQSYEWDAIDAICRWADIPFIVKEWVRLVELNSEDAAWPIYAHVFESQAYEKLGWSDYNKQYLELRRAGQIEEEIPLLNKEKLIKLRRKWGENYSEEELYYLEDLYIGLQSSQNINGALQIDQAQKICKLSLEIDSRIRSGDKDVDKFLSSYDKLVKTAEFTPKNSKNANNFDSFAEVARWLEKRGRQNKFYDGATRDVIDETLKNIENYNQRLYINEGGIGDEITERIQSLQLVNAKEESVFNLQKDYNLDEYDNDGFNVKENEEFLIEDEDGNFE